MGHFICHHNDRFNVFSSVTDSFLFDGPLTLEQLERHIEEQSGARSLAALDERVQRARANGCSSLTGESLKELLVANRAGDHESELGYEDCLRRFLGAK